MIVDCPSCAAKFRIPPEAVSPDGRRLRCSSCGHIWVFFPPPEGQQEPALPPDSAPPPEVVQEEAAIPAPPASSVAPADLPASVLPPEHQEAPSDKGAEAAAEEGPVPDMDFATALRQARARPPAPPQAARRFSLSRMHVRGYAASVGILIILVGGLVLAKDPLTRSIPKTQALYTLFGAKFDTGSPLVLDRVQVATKDRHGLAAQIEVTGNLINLSDRDQAVKPLRVKLLGEDGKQVVASWVFRPDAATLKGEDAAPFSTTKSVPDVTDVVLVELDFVMGKVEE